MLLALWRTTVGMTRRDSGLGLGPTQFAYDISRMIAGVLFGWVRQVTLGLAWCAYPKRFRTAI